MNNDGKCNPRDCETVEPEEPCYAVPQTGQTICYDVDGVEIDCTGTGQDGEYQMGVVCPDPRFTDNGDGTVTDNCTGLMWLKDANCIDTNYPEFDDITNISGPGDGLITWQQALDFVAGINDETYHLCSSGYTDWRVPNARELFSAADIGGKWGSDVPFVNLIGGRCWSSTTRSRGDLKQAMQVNVREGLVSVDGKYKDAHRVWPVRGGN
jgi:hypothetical protein